MSKQLVQPNPNTRDWAGWCLRFAQKVFNAPVRYNSAWDAWEATQLKHYGREMPDVSVLVWFSHYGSYGTPQTYANWGHVVTYFPGRGYLSSPANGEGQLWLNSIEAVEKTFNAKFVGWSEDINSLRVAETGGAPQPIGKGNNEMYLVQDTTGRGFIVTPNRMEWVQDPGEWEILKRILSSNPGDPDTFVSNQLDAVKKYFH